jgi:FemAB-related protein (PEP-CTERM system-associated)
MRRVVPSTQSALWDGLDRKVRNQVRKAQKEGLTVVSGGDELLAEFYDVFARNMRDLGTPVHSRRLFDETLRLFPERARIFVVRHGRTAAAGAVALQFGDTTVVPWASSRREFRHLCANMLLYWAMLERSVHDGVRCFDFGRSSPGGGTYQFKLQWGASESPQFWEYVLVTRPNVPDQGPTNPRFQAAIRLWQRLPVGISRILGPALARHLA